MQINLGGNNNFLYTIYTFSIDILSLNLYETTTSSMLPC